MQAAERQVRRPGGHEKLRALWNRGHTCACRSEEEVEGEWREVRTEGLTAAVQGCGGSWGLGGCSAFCHCPSSSGSQGFSEALATRERERESLFQSENDE